MRDVVFLVADGAMEQMLRGFFGRRVFHRSLGCGHFTFDPDFDVIVAPARDSDVYGRAHELLRPFESSHARAVAMLDAAWDGGPEPDQIHEHVTRRLSSSWPQSAVVVFAPELEAWIWQDNPNVAAALGCPLDFRQLLANSGHWPEGRSKPLDPKAALDHLRQRHRADRSNAVFRRLAARISVRDCADPAFLRLRDTLRDWFPEDSL